MARLLDAVPAKSRFRARGPLILGSLAFLALGALYWSYVTRRSNYLIDRDLRLLGAAAAQLDAQIDSHKGVLRNFAHADFWCDKSGKPITEYGPNSPPWMRTYMPDFVSASRGPKAKLAVDIRHPTPAGTFDQQLVPNGDGSYNVEVQYRNSKNSWDRSCLCAPRGSEPKAIGQFPLNELLKPIFDKPIFAVFDAVLVASNDGRVLYQAEPGTQQERRLVWNRMTPAVSNDSTGISSVVIANLANFRDPDSKQEKAIDIARLQDRTGSFTVDISGSSYRLFTQPYIYEAPPLAKGASGRWIVCGLIERRRFLQEATEISASLIALAAALMILIACCWPFMKLAFSGAAEPVTRSDVVMVAVAILLASGIVSLVFLDLVIYGRIKSSSDYQHRAFAANTIDEIHFALANMLAVRNALEARSGRYADQYERFAAKGRAEAARASLDNFGRPPRGDPDPKWADRYTSLFSSFAWINDSGKQVIRASMTEGKPPLLDVSKRAYFENVVRQKRAWLSSDRGDDRIHLRYTAFKFERTAASERQERKNADDFRLKVLKKDFPSLWKADVFNIRRRLWDELQQAVLHLRPGEISPVIRTPDAFFVCQLAEEPQRQQFVVESVRTLTNGQPEAVIAFPTGRKWLPLLTITFPFVQLVERLGPEAMNYAVVDDSGTVLFHTDSERNNIENIFTETDHDRQLRAAVIARHEEFIDAKYWGEDVRILVSPLKDMPWTLLTFRDKRLLRTMNLETLVVSLLLFLMCLGAPLALVVGIMLARPSYRARWAWPLPSRYSDWRDLLRLYLVTLLAFAVCIYTFSPLPRLVIAFAMPVQALLGTYLLLDRDPKRLAHGLAVIAWTLLTAGLFAGIIAADLRGEVLPYTAASAVVRAILLVLALIAVHAVLVRQAAIEVPWRKFARTYTACGVLIVLLMAVLPMITFFQTAIGNEVEALVKAGQLDLANRLMRRMEALTDKSWKSDPNMSLWYHMPFFFESTWCVQTDLFSAMPNTFGHLRQPCDRTSSARGSNEFTVPFDEDSRPAATKAFTPAFNELGERIENVLPMYSDHTIPMRDLHHGAAVDQSWYTLRAGRILALFRRLDVNNRTRDALIADIGAAARLRATEHLVLQLRHQNVTGKAAADMADQAITSAEAVFSNDEIADPVAAARLKPLNREALRYLEFAHQEMKQLRAGGQWLVIISRMPLVFPAAFVTPDLIRPFPRGQDGLFTDENYSRVSFPGPPPDPPWPSLLRRAPFVLAVLAALGALLLAVRFIAQRIFLYDLRDSDWFRALPLRPPFSDHLFVISAEEQVEKLIDVGDCCRIRFREYTRSGARMDVLDLIGRAGSATHVVLEDFGYRIADAEFTKWKFDLLGSLVQLGDRTIIVVSPVPPTLLLTAPGEVEDGVRERWSAILRSFVWIDSARNLVPPAVRLPAGAAGGAHRVRRFFIELDQAIDQRMRAVVRWVRQFTAKGRTFRDEADDLRWLYRETRHSAVLRQLRPQLRPLVGRREQMIDELCERTDKYYEALWQMCSAQERVVLFHIAQYGVANGSNRRLLRRLLTRGLLTREPELRLFNDTFRRFVGGREEDVRKQRELDPAAVTTWDQLRIPLFIGLLVVAGVFLGTQKELANATSAIVTALATGLPVIVKLIGTFTDRRLAATQR